MKQQRVRFLALAIVFILSLAASGIGPAQGQDAAPMAALQAALDQYNSAHNSDLGFVLAGQEGSQAYASAAPQAADHEFFLVLLAEARGTDWQVLIPGESPDDEYNRLLDAFSEHLIDPVTKAMLRRPEPALDSGPALTATTNYIGHRLPWPYGQSGYVTQRDATYHMNQIDFDIRGLAASGAVYSSKPGTVVFVKDSSNTNCKIPAPDPCWKKSNMVVVQHDSGEYSWYVHLAYRSATVSVGQRIGFGSKLGIEGDTGYSFGVHLHYMASSGRTAWTDPNNPNDAPWAINIYPVDFDEYPWSALIVTYASTYMSQNGANLPPVCPGSGGVLLYRDANYGCAGLLENFGYSFRNGAGSQNLTVSFNDTASAARVPDGWSVLLYQNANRGGGKKCFNGPGDGNFSDNTFDNGDPINDQVSSFEVFEAPGCPLRAPADLTAPDGSLTSPAAGATVGRYLTLTAAASDGQSGVQQVGFRASWGGQERAIYTASSAPYSYTWDLCAAGVPDGPVDLGLSVLDNAWNAVSKLPVRVTKSYDCAAVPDGVWSASYFANPDLSGDPVLQNELASPLLFLDWGSASPDAGIPADGWSARFTRSFDFPGGAYRFHCQSAGGCRLWIDDEERISAWQEGELMGASWSGTLAAGSHTVRVEFFDADGEAKLEAWWQGEGFLPVETACSADQWCAETWGNPGMAGTAAVRRSEGETLARDWASAGPDALLPADNFSRRFTRSAPFDCATYRFHIATSDAVQLWIADTLLIDQWSEPAQPALYSADLALNRGPQAIVLEQADLGGSAALEVGWEKISSCPASVALESVSSHVARPGALIEPAVRVLVNSGYLDPARGDGLAHVSGSTFSAGPGLVRSLVESGQRYTFDSSNGFTMLAPSSDGTYSGQWQVRAGGSQASANATVGIIVDSRAPLVSITAPAGYLKTSLIPIQAALSDSGSGISHAQFIAGYNDGSGWAWRSLGYDTNGSDGWSLTWDASSVADQAKIIFLAAAWDRAGNSAETRSGEMTLDRTPPSVSISQPALTQYSTRFQVTWSGSDALAGLQSFDVQVRTNGGSWQAWQTNVPAATRSAWFTGQMGSAYEFRVRGVDAAGNSSAYSTPTQASLINICTGDAFEPDNLPEQALALAAGSPPELHTLCGIGDEDWFSFQPAAGTLYMFYTSSLGATTNTVLSLVAADGVTKLAEDAGPSSIRSGSVVLWRPASGENLYFKVRHADPQVAGSAVTYSAQVAEAKLVFLPVINR